MNLIFWSFLILYILWLAFVLNMSFRRYWSGLGFIAKILAAPVIIIGFLLDVAVNFAATIVFLDLPQEWTLSHRFKRYNSTIKGSPYDNWRLAIADWVCTHLLDQFDPDGDHC